jgi:hypothetical protein
MAARNWCFTLNNPKPEECPRTWPQVKWVTWQLEEGDEGTPHWQGVVEMSCVKRMTGMKKINSRAHWEVTRDVAKAVGYCKKSNSRKDGPWEHGEPKQQGQRSDLEAAYEVAITKGMRAVVAEHPTAAIKYYKNLDKIAKDARLDRIKVAEKEEMKDVVLYEWQQRLMDKLSKSPDSRKIMWYWETEGNVGKTFMAKYLLATKDATVLDCSKKNDLTYMLRDHTGDTVLFNIVRSIDEQFMGHVYGLCEAIKDDLVISTKYETCRIPLGKQHVVVFANIAPDMSKWSDDRYDVVPIDMSSPWNPKPQTNKRKRSDDDDPNGKKRVAIDSYTMDSMYA